MCTDNNSLLMIRKFLLATLFIFCTAFCMMAQVSPKRGMAYGNHSKADLDAVKVGASWWYNWSDTPDAAIASYYSSQGVEFVPLMYNNSYTVATAIANIPSGAKYLLAFNEPNFNAEANMTPAQAAAAWPKLEQIAAAKNLQIISAAAAYCGGSACIAGYTDPVKWHDDFFAACPTCKVDFIAFHNYEPTVGGLTGLTNNLKKYGKPIWVTEFAYWDPTASATSKQTYLQQAVSAFENDPDIFRYSWFQGRSAANSTINILGADGTLTALGSAYIGAAYGPKNNIPGKIEVEKLYRRRGTSFQTTTDAGGGQNVGFTDPGTWNEYLVDVSTTGSYTFRFRVASNVGTGKFDIKLDDNLVKSNVTIANTGGWQTWTDYDVTGIVLTAGEHLVKFEFTGTGTNMNYFTTIFETTVPAVADFSATPLSTCAGNQVVFTDLTTVKNGSETYAWNFGAGASPATASGVGPHTITYSTGGQKTPSLTVTNSNGSNSSSKSNYVTVASPPTGCLFSDDFNNNTVNWIAPIPGAFSHTESGTSWTISNGGYGEWENFNYALNNGSSASPLNFQCAANKPVITIRAKASANCLLSLTLMDVNGRTIDNTNLTNLELTTTYQTFTINFAGKFRNYYGGNPGILDSSTISKLQLAINPGFYSYPITGANGTYNSAFGGTVDIDWIGIGNSCTPPTLASPTVSSFTPNCGLTGTSVTLTGTNLSGTTSVSFNGTLGNITSNTATQIIVTAPAGMSSGVISISTPTGFVSTATPFNLNPVTGGINGLASVCANATGQVYSVTNTPGSSYNWTLPTGAAITAGAGTNSITINLGTANGNVAVTETNTGGCVGVQQTKALTVNALPTTALAGIDQNITVNSTALAGNSASVGTGSWSLVSGAGTLTNNNQPTSAVTSLGTGTNVFRWTITNATCSSFDDVNVNVSIPLGILEESNATNSYSSSKDSYYFSPNPFEQSATLTLHSNKNLKCSVKIVDMRGVCWYASDNHASNEPMELGKDLPAGVYTVLLIYSDTLDTFKVIKTE
jgi:PKD repeat protein